jgi:Rod binding domain-containing protein
MTDFNIKNFASLATLKQHSDPTKKFEKLTHGRFSDDQLAEMRESAESFEAFFLSQTFQEMFKGVKANSMFGGGFAEDTWRSMLVDQYGKEVAAKGGIGLADHVVQSMIKMQNAVDGIDPAAPQNTQNDQAAQAYQTAENRPSLPHRHTTDPKTGA